eukprot:c9829_g1_i1.p1 GENE.c9829_g1_i1~~c9829_g1_i1.p1  ORF type:complete len:314 (+),score=54.97 c9829_g1_i1:283-1224(+)
MFACGIDSYCRSKHLTSKYCDSFSILSDICSADHMSKMSNCTNWSKLCTPNNTMVSQCSQDASMPNVLTTDSSKTAIKNLCTSMTMSECKQCVVPSTNAACDCSGLSSTCAIPSSSSLFLVLSDICLGMPGMSDCSGFSQMCLSAGSDFNGVCSSGSSGSSGSEQICNGQGTVMFMDGFKGSLKKEDACVAFLFSNWVMDTKVKLAFGLLGAFAMGLLQSLIGLANKRFAKQHPPLQRSYDVYDIIRFGIFLLETTNGYLLMLLAMSFFSGLFIAVVCGLAVGRILFNRTAQSNHCAMGETTPLNSEDVLHYS